MINLPTEKTIAVLDAERITMLNYGDFKIGKTTWASKIKKALFLFTEEGQGALDVYRVTINSWQDFLDVCLALKEDSQKPKEEQLYTTVVIDTVDLLYKLCQDHVCAAAGVQHPSDKSVGWGKGWDLLSNEFSLTLAKLMNLGYGVIFISHMKEKEIITRNSSTTVIKPSLKDGAMQIVSALVGFIAYSYAESVFAEDGTETTVRKMLIGPNEKMQTGSRYAHLLPEIIPMDFVVFQKMLKEGFKQE